jgi:hypothetical protein
LQVILIFCFTNAAADAQAAACEAIAKNGEVVEAAFVQALGQQGLSDGAQAGFGRDEPGRTAIDWGVYGVPETYLLDRQGMIRWRWAGPITADTLENELRPLLRRYA